jgi:hypothetical protein
VNGKQYSDWVTGWTTGVRFSAGAGHFFFLPPRPDRLWGPQSLLSIGYSSLLPGGAADHSPPSSNEAKNEWIYTFTPPYAFVAWCLVTNMDNFIFYFTRGHDPTYRSN